MRILSKPLIGDHKRFHTPVAQLWRMLEQATPPSWLRPTPQSALYSIASFKAQVVQWLTAQLILRFQERSHFRSQLIKMSSKVGPKHSATDAYMMELKPLILTIGVSRKLHLVVQGNSCLLTKFFLTRLLSKTTQLPLSHQLDQGSQISLRPLMLQTAQSVPAKSLTMTACQSTLEAQI